MNERKKSPKAVCSDLIDVDTVAKLLEVTDRTVRNKAATGLLKKYRVGRRVFYKKQQVFDLLFKIGDTHEKDN
jgi:excisionase family DNA binding protein